MGEGKRSTWVYVGVGCIAAIVFVVLAAVGVGWYAHRAVKRYADEINDPVAREAKVKRVLGAQTLPSGYQPLIALSVPWVMDVAILSDHELGGGARGNLGQRGFLYLSMLSTSATDRSELRDFVAGRRRTSNVLARQQVSVAATATLGRGQFTQGPASVSYVVQRGEMAYSKPTHRGLQALVLFECPNDQRTRVGLWLLPDPEAASAAGSEAAATGVPDEAALRAFLAPFNVCGR
jgi:hypothetical protein